MNEEVDWYGPDMATFGDRVAGAREAAGMNQKDLAKRLGIRTATLKSWEEDLSEPRANRLSMMAGLLNVSVMWLINGEGEGMESPPDTNEISGDLRDLLTEMRVLRAELKARSEHVGRLEKRLVKILAEQGHDRDT